MKSKTFYRVYIKTALGHLYYLSDNDMSTPGVGPDGKSTVDSFDHESENFAFISNCTPDDVYHFSSKSKAEDAIKSLPFPYNEKCQLMAINDPKYSLYKRIYYRIGKIDFPVGSSWCDAEGNFTDKLPKGPKTLFVDRSAGEEFLSKLENPPIGAAVFEFYDFGAPDFIFWYKTNSGAIYTNEGAVKSPRTDIDLKKCSFGEVGTPEYVGYRFCKKTPEGMAWMSKDNIFKTNINDETLSLYTLEDAKKYAEINTIDCDVEIAEIYSSGSPKWEWNYKILSTGKVYNSSSVELTE
jgi:hypothetical protein